LPEGAAIDAIVSPKIYEPKTKFGSDRNGAFSSVEGELWDLNAY